MAGGGRGRGRGAAGGGDLKGVTTRMKPGYLQKNGVPYGANAGLSEYFLTATEPNGATWPFVTHLAQQPQDPTRPIIPIQHDKKLPDTAASSWAPEPCSAR